MGDDPGLSTGVLSVITGVPAEGMDENWPSIGDGDVKLQLGHVKMLCCWREGGGCHMLGHRGPHLQGLGRAQERLLWSLRRSRFHPRKRISDF